MSTLRKLTLVAAIFVASGLIGGCTLLEDIAAGLARVCETEPLVVTKPDDTNDGLCTADDCSLREAVVTANNCPGPQTISVPGGTYVFSRIGAGEDAADTGDLDITEAVTIEGELGASVVVDAAGLDRAFQILPGAGEVVIEGLRIRNGLVERPTGWTRGGGIMNEATLTLRRSGLLENRVAGLGSTTFISSGGGLFNGGTATLINVEVRGNESVSPSGGKGGGVYSTGRLTLSEVRFEENRADNQGGGFYNAELGVADAGNTSFVRNRADKGGGLTNDGELTLTRVAFTGNAADTIGGGVWNQFGQLDGSMVAFASNHANGGGGGFYNWEPATATLVRSAFHENSSGDFAGGVYNEGEIRLEQVSLTRNSGASGAGALYQSSAPTSMELVNVTVSDNVSSSGNPAVFSGSATLLVSSSTIANNSNFGLYAGSNATVVNTIISGNPTGDCNPRSMISSGGHNLIGDGSCGLSGAGDLIGDPDLQPLISDGWVGRVHPLGASSPAVNAGVGAPDCPALDQRSVGRPQGPACDIGAYEREGGGGGAAEPTAVPTATPTPMATTTVPTVEEDTLCWEGPGPGYSAVSALTAGTEVEILGRGIEGDWWVIDNPRYPGVPCWTPGDDVQVDSSYEYPNTLFEIPPLPTPTPAGGPEIEGCLYQGPNDNQPVCYPIDQCPVDLEDTEGACEP